MVPLVRLPLDAVHHTTPTPDREERSGKAALRGVGARVRVLPALTDVIDQHEAPAVQLGVRSDSADFGSVVDSGCARATSRTRLDELNFPGSSLPLATRGVRRCA
ncbi:hypothetical protein [Umezawaea beigongshangensis]|uniref:hypothetical protein n=1 Tax=Umezawaea beigongshangensis TaxID=2780383 RepID=UPI0018F1C79D|nr:hypothetical protein [Umezawaea beigongshangensis]